MTHEEALKPLDSAIWEMGEAFDGMPDEEVWVRAHPRLLSVGELAAHVAFGLARWMRPSISSPLFVDRIDYYLSAVEHPHTGTLGASALYEEIKRVHAECKAYVLETRPDLTDQIPSREDWTWGYTLEYMAFHVAYHTGQMYSVRHILGHDTPNN